MFATFEVVTMLTRVAIITGASSGIGRALAERAVRAGWNVFAVGRRGARLVELASIVTGATGELATLELDLRTPGAAKRIVSETLARFGRIDVLVNNAGGVAVGDISQQHDDALYEQMETHVIVPLALTREALPALRASRGLVMYFGSGVARIPVGTLGAYPPAKAAVRSMARIARNELRPAGIAVTYVDPGAVATEFMTRAGFAGPPPGVAALPAAVARRVFAAFTTRKPIVNAVPWQTFLVGLGELVPAATDFFLSKAPSIVGGQPTSEQPKLAAPAPQIAIAPPSEPVPLPEPAEPLSEFDAALASQSTRMAKFKMTPAFVRTVLVPGEELELGEIAMRWAGMPNKHERALTNDVLDALASAGYLEHLEPERYRVTRTAEG
jgi:short-subunit dehydrogenase